MRFLLIFLCSLFIIETFGQIREPYKPLHGGRYTADTNPASPDPLINYRWDNPLASDSLQLYNIKPKIVRSIPNEAFRQRGDVIFVLGEGTLKLDFGIESAGWLEFDSDDLEGDVEMSISEYNEPAILNAGSQYPVKTRTATRHGNTYRLELNDGLYEGVRFGWIHVKHFSKSFQIRNVRLVCQIKPVNYNGSFSCDDEELNKIWYTGAYVVKLNLLQKYLGAILMERSDRHSWTGDAYPAQAAALAAFGNYDFIKKNIEFTSPQDNGIAAYSLYWVLSLIDYYNYTGDVNFLKAYQGNAVARLEKAYQHYDNLPKLGFMGWDERLGAGFENTQIQEAQYTYRMLCINAWKQFARLMVSTNEPALADKFRQYAEVKGALLKSDKKIFDDFGIHAVSEAINAGLLNEPAVRTMSEKLFTDRQNRLSYSPFNQYFIIQAMAAAGKKDEAITTIRDNWGGQLKYGGTTFFEVFRPSWNIILKNNDAPPNNQCGYTSLAHPWGAGVTKWLSENVLGIQPVTAGFKTFSVIPFLSTGITKVKGDMPTPLGNIAFSFDSGSGAGELTIPEGAKAEKIGLPKIGGSIQSITLNGQTYWKSGAGKSDKVEEDPGYVYIKDIGPGRYTFSVKFGSKRISKVEKINPITYPLQSFRQDSISGGAWKGKYGSDGYMLLGEPLTNDSKRLPAYIEDISTRLNGVVVWDSESNDSRVLESGAGDLRRAAAIITKDPVATLQTMTIDIASKKNQSFQVALYFLDYDRDGRRSAVEIFDSKTLDIIAPVQMINHYEKGRYLIFKVDRPLRIRVNHVRGKNAALSGIFFDKL